MQAAYIFEGFLFFVFVFPFIRKDNKIRLALGSALFMALYLPLKVYLERYYYLNLPGMLFLSGGYLCILGIIPVRNCFLLGGVFAIAIDLGRIIVYGPLQIMSMYEFYMRYSLELRLLTFFSKTVTTLFCRKMLRPYMSRKVGLLDFLLLLISFAFLTYMRAGLMTRTNLTDRDLYLNRQNFYVASFSIVTSLFGLFFHISSGYRQAELSVLTEHIRQNYLLAMQRQEMDTEVMRMYHDIKNQLIGIAGTDDGAVRRVRAERLLEQVKGFERIAYSGNSVLDALLNSKAEKAAGQQTTLNLFIEKNEYFCLDSMDLCSIIGNALDNALEAVAMLKPDERTVNMKMAVVKGVLVIKVENPYQGELQMENNRLLSRKPGPHHGIGLSSIQYSTEKNGGKMQLDICEQKFSLKIMIPAGEPPVPR